DRTMTGATTTGISLQATNTGTLFGHRNRLVAGGGVDHGNVNFQSNSTLGFLNSNLVVVSNPAIPGDGSLIHTLGGFGYVPVNIDTRNTYYGLYALNVFDVTEPLSFTLGGRLNIADIGLSDQAGTAPNVNGSHTYTHLNPVTGLTYKVTPRLTAFGGWSTANRAPTPVELACSDPLQPCLIESQLVSDPPLKQVVAHTYEIGLRDRRPLGGGELQAQFALFRTNTSDDIVSVASTISGRGFFQNVPGTRRQGLDTGLRYDAAQWSAYVNYSFLDATYQFTGDLPSPNNPMADPDGNVHVVPGDRIPGIPQHLFKMGAEYQPIPKLRLGADIVVVGSRFFVGDDANQNPKLPGYWVTNLRASYQLTERVQIFGLVNNLFDRRYALFGTYFNPEDVENVSLPVVLNDRRTEVLGPPFSIYGGVRVTF
ncbi:MAG: TonB-dependent receptor, partial [Alphaproteobacteria bacterium]